jgi:pilus assembly protein Flp/PilA
MLKRLFKNRRGAALVEYGLLVGGIALIAAGAVSIFGHKTTDIIGTMAAIIPGAHTDDNGPLISGKLIETKAGITASGGTTGIGVDFSKIADGVNTNRLGINVAGSSSAGDIAKLILEP